VGGQHEIGYPQEWGSAADELVVAILQALIEAHV
jgi:hypothetical protein